MEKEKRCRWMLMASMTAFGTIGLFRRWIPLPSGAIAMARGLIGAAFLMLVLWVKKKRSTFLP